MINRGVKHLEDVVSHWTLEWFRNNVFPILQIDIDIVEWVVASPMPTYADPSAQLCQSPASVTSSALMPSTVRWVAQPCARIRAGGTLRICSASEQSPECRKGCLQSSVHRYISIGGQYTLCVASTRFCNYIVVVPLSKVE